LAIESIEQYLQPSVLCDFDRSPDIIEKARSLTSVCRTEHEKFRRIFSFVKELPYGLDDWDVAASETLSKGWGMCSGKTNLLVALLRCAGIPSRYRIYAIKSERRFWGKVVSFESRRSFVGDSPIEQDHVDCEVWLDEWIACDPTSDTALERGLLALGVPLERQPVLDGDGKVPFLRLACFDEWAMERQDSRRFREGRRETFAGINDILWRIREKVRSAGQHRSE
jgi:transglutaminase-like putative cysteine protease